MHWKKPVTRGWQVLVLIVILLLLGTGISLAQSKTLHWERMDIDITILPNGDMLVEEYHDIAFTSGEFRVGYRYIELGRLDAITDIEVWEGNRKYTESSGENPDTFRSWRESGRLNIEWYFSPTSNTNRDWVLRYRVAGGLRIYEDGDQVYWRAIFPDRDQSVRNSTITVHLPASFSPDQLLVAVYLVDTADQAQSADHLFTWEMIDSSTVEFNSKGLINPRRGVEVRVQFPHGIVQADPSAWQKAEDRLIDYQERWKPLVDIGMLALGFLLLVGGAVGIYLLWHGRGRDTPVGLVAEYLTEPPSDLPPAVAGTLVDQSADMADIVATIVDLARRGIIQMEEMQETGLLGIGKKKDFRYRLVVTDAELLPYEQRLIRGMFGTGAERLLSDLRNKFYQVIPQIKKLLYEEVVKREFFGSNPETTRSKYSGLGVGGMVIFGCLAFFLASMLEEYTGYGFCPPLSLVLVGLGFLVVSRFMPARTEKGSEENARWVAFKRYLEKIESYQDVKEATELFDRYLPYAIAFGLEKTWIKKFADVGTPAPGWFVPYPTTMTGRGQTPMGTEPLSGGAGANFGAPGMPREAGAPSLDGMSSGMFNSLSSMSSGLFSMLDTASNTLSSSPRSSGSGGFSGGGGGGRGGGGGGGGFR